MSIILNNAVNISNLKQNNHIGIAILKFIFKNTFKNVFK